jgi:hypothetical protein
MLPKGIARGAEEFFALVNKRRDPVFIAVVEIPLRFDKLQNLAVVNSTDDSMHRKKKK